MKIFLIFGFLLVAETMENLRFRRGSYMRPQMQYNQYNQDNYQNSYYPTNSYNRNPYRNYNNWNNGPYPNDQWNNQWNNQYQSNNYGSSGYGRPSQYSRPVSSYGRPQPSYQEQGPAQGSSYGRPVPNYSTDPQFNQQVANNPTEPPIETKQESVFQQPQMPPSQPEPQSFTDYPITEAPPTTPLFGGVGPGEGTMPPMPPTDEEMTRVDAAEKENEVRKARGGPPGINVEQFGATGTLPPQAAVPEIPMPPV